MSRLCNPSIILVRPQLEENVGSVARVMMNFGFLNLVLVEPKCNWLSEKSMSVACRGRDVLCSATNFSNLEEAVHDFTNLYALSARERSIPINSIELSDISQSDDLKAGVILGPENSGLSNHDLSLVNKVVSIDTSLECRSLNLAHAVAIVCYELSKRNAGKNVFFKRKKVETQIAKKQELNAFFKSLETKLINKNFFKTKEKIPKAMLNIKTIFKDFTSDEIKTFHGIINALSKND